MTTLFEPGDEFTILVDGAPVETYIDEYGTQRFRQNGVIDWLFRSGQVSLNQLWMDYYTNSEADFSREALIEFYMALGYSICGFDEIFGPGSSFESNGGDPAEIINPLWLDKEDPEE